MSTSALRSLLLVAVLWLAGCERAQVIVVNHPPQPLPPEATVVYVDDEATVLEIDAVRRLSFEPDRAAHLLRIAGRQNVGPRGQVHLVETAFDALRFEKSRLDVLLRLIDNPVFCVEAKSAIIQRLNQLTFDMHRNQILHALDRRGQPTVFPVADGNAPVS